MAIRTHCDLQHRRCQPTKMFYSNNSLALTDGGDYLGRGGAAEETSSASLRSYRCLALGRYDHQRVWRQLGTLGGGNHFIELCLDEDEGVWVMLHSGGRNIGNTIGQTAISVARERALRENILLPDRDLAWLDEGSTAFAHYVEALNWAQEYAALNRDLMLARLLHAVSRAMGREIDLLTEVVNCHHNYASLEQHFGERLWITRKGAVSARVGELGIVPGSMGARSFIVRGKGNPDSYSSCSHGAGRRMSRGEAKRRFTQQDLLSLA